MKEKIHSDTTKNIIKLPHNHLLMRSVLRSKFVITYIKSCFRELSFLMIIIILLEIIRHEDSRRKASRNILMAFVVQRNVQLILRERIFRVRNNWSYCK